MTTGVGTTLTMGYDGLRRLSTVTGDPFNRSYAYRDISSTATTLQVSQLSYPNLGSGVSFGYTYDNLGNIATYTAPDGEVITYSYDNQGQLLKAEGDATYLYVYDSVGNILTANGHTYTYGDANWKDLLTAFDGQSITYDASGNPTSYFNGTRWNFTWVNGRTLATASDGTNSLSFAYDANGLRTSKTVNGTTYRYYYAGGKLMRMTWDTNTIDFFYDANGAPYAMKYNGTVYYYVTNLQGDVMRIVNASGTVMASYDYDPYGKVISATGTLANVNPLRYRGYVYDQETGFYYLQSRYYDPAIGRFINADGLMSTTQKVLGHNMFAYGYNSSVNCVDPTGCCPHDGKFYTSGVFSGQFEYNAECSLCAAHGEFYLVGAGNVLINMVQFALSYEQKVLISTIAAEASVTALGTPVSSQARQAMANVALNRVGSREWSRYTSVAEICQYTGFDGYGGSNYWACMNYLNQRDGSNSIYEEIIWDVLSAYENDITNGCQLYYTPAAMQGNKRPNWNFSLLEEEYIYGVDSVYEGCFFRYK